LFNEGPAREISFKLDKEPRVGEVDAIELEHGLKEGTCVQGNMETRVLA